MPGETKTIQMEVKKADTRGESPTVLLEGINVQ
jgi:hypothetical protein